MYYNLPMQNSLLSGSEVPLTDRVGSMTGLAPGSASDYRAGAWCNTPT